MKIKLMRNLDLWLGIPLCFLFSLLNYIFKLMHFKKREGKITKNILFIKLSELGAIILSYPLLKKIKTKYPDAELFFITFADNSDIFKLLGGIIPEENILLIRKNSISAFVQDIFKSIIILRKKKMGIIFDLEFFSRISALISSLVKSDKKIGFYPYGFAGLYRGNFLTHRAQYNPLTHISINYLSLSQGIEMETKYSPQLYAPIEDKEITFPAPLLRNETREKIKPKLNKLGINAHSRIFLLNPGEGILPIREWPLNNFISLSGMILEKINNYIIIIGTEGVIEKAKILTRELNNPRCINLIGQTTLEELIGIFHLADALITNDCGLAHLAMLTSIKKFIIFGPESPKVFGPLGENNYIIYTDWPCSPCLSVLNHRVSLCADNKCLKAIQPNDVFKLIKNSIANK